MSHKSPFRRTYQSNDKIMALQQQGMKSIEIAAFMGMAPRTVREWLDRGDIPYSGSRKPRARLIDPYQIYLRERWQQGCQKASTIGKRTQSKRVSRVITSNLSVLGDVRSIELLCPQKRFPISDQTAQSPGNSLGTTGHLALFPQAREFEARRTRDAPAIEAG